MVVLESWQGILHIALPSPYCTGFFARANSLFNPKENVEEDRVRGL